MSNIDPSELFALLDGELDPGRAREVEALLASDPAFRAEFDMLARVDSAWRNSARMAAFRPSVRWPDERRWYGSALGAMALAAGLVVLRVVPPLLGGWMFGFAVNGIAIAIVLAAVTRVLHAAKIPLDA